MEQLEILPLLLLVSLSLTKMDHSGPHFQKLYEQIMPEKPETSLTLLGRENPCNNIFKAREFLEQTHALENMREDFLERELEKMCLESGQESQYAEHITAGMKRSKPVPSHQNRKTIEVVEP